MGKRKIRVLAALPGIEGHDRGITLVCQALRGAGMEVIYLGRFNTPQKIVNAAIEEDVDVIALSYLGDHLYMKFFTQVVELLKENKAEDIRVVVGGRITPGNRPTLEKMGITGFFGQGTPLDVIVKHVFEVGEHSQASILTAGN